MRVPGIPRFGLRADQAEYLHLILLAAVVGVLGALGNLGFRALIDFFSWLFREVEWSAIGIAREGLWLVLIPLVLASGAALTFALEWLFPGDVLGYGFPDFIEQVNLGNAQIKRRFILLKGVGAALSLGAGWSVGREGPIAQIGGAIGSAIAQLRKLAPERAKVLVAAGAGAGIATTFNAPIGGLMFAQEIVLLGHAEIANLTLLVIATTIAVVTSRAVMGNEAVFQVPQFVLRSYWEMLTYGLMGVAMGLLGAGFIRFFYRVADGFKRLKVPKWAKLGLGAIAVGAIAIPLPQNLSDGYPIINAAMAGHFELWTLAALTAAKFVASAISLDAGAPGGVFGPLFFIGTMGGATLQRIFARLLPGLTGPRGSYALVGLGAFLGAATHAPLTALFLMFEMTQNYAVTLPAMIATVSALIVARAIESESIDTYRLAREGKMLHIGPERVALSHIPVSAVMTTNVTTLPENAPLPKVLRVAGETAQSVLPVVSSDGRLSGLIVTRDLLILLTRGEELSPLVNAFDLCNPNCATVRPDTNLDLASELMESEGLDELPVSDAPNRGRFLGLITRHHIAMALNRVTVSLTALARGDDAIHWATGYRVTRLTVPPAAGGSTIRGLDPRARFGVTVLALRDADNRDAGFVPVTPDRALKPGDMLVVAGRTADVRRFERSLVQGQMNSSTA